MTRTAVLFGIVIAAIAPRTAFALGSEEIGNKPIGPGWGFGAEMLAAVNMDERVYWREVNGNPTFYFNGAPKELNLAIRRFVAIPAEKREIILLPGAGATRTFGGQPIAFDWSLHIPAGLHFQGDSAVSDDRATFTIHVNTPVPPPPGDPVKVKQRIEQLNSDDFKTRELAAKELAAIGQPVARLIREAIKGTLSTEARDRLERVLAGVSRDITLDILDLPAGNSVVGLENLLVRSRLELTNKAHDVRGYAMSNLSQHCATAEEILPDLEKVLTNEKHEYPLRCATSAASRLGTAAKPLLPALRDLLKSDDKNVKASAEYAIDAIEKAKPEVISEAEVKSRAALRKEIREFVAEREKKKR